MKELKRKEKPQKQGLSFMQQVSMLPEVMQRRFLGQMVAAVAITILTIVLMIFYRTWQFCVGFLIGLYVLYMAMDLIWSFYKGVVVCKRMVCIKAKKLLKRGRVFVIMQDWGSKDATNHNTKQFYIVANKEDAELITPQTVMDIYYREDHPLEATAWEIVGNLGSN